MPDHYLHPVYDAHLVQQAVDLHDDLVRTIHLLHHPRRHGELGDILFRLAFPDSSAWISFANDLATAANADDTLRVWVPGADPRLSALPWEYLRVPDYAAGDLRECGVKLDSRFLALHPHCLVVRDETRGRTAPALRPLGRLRVLVVWANPGAPPDWPSLDSFPEEAARVRRGLERLGSAFVEFREVPQAGAREFLDAVAEYQPDVIHFCGHGHHPNYTGPAGAPAVPALVCGRDGVPEYLTAEDLV